MNLLTEPLLRVQTRAGPTGMSLPQLLAALGRDEVDHLIGIQQHQEDAFHVFLCYLAGAVLVRQGDVGPGQSEDYWREGLRALAGAADDSAWTLVVADQAKPAFMQSPLPRGAEGTTPSSTALTPDELDVLQTAKNHDVKAAKIQHAEPDAWIYGLVSMQTMSGFLGRDNYGISRMNSGFGNRPIVELLRSTSMGGRWHDAVTRLLGYRAEVLSGPFGYKDGGLALVWTAPWDGTSSLNLNDLDPFYIEICRRVRLRSDKDIIVAERFGTKVSRIAAKDLKGVVGDGWLPVDLGDAGKSADIRALTVSARGLTPDLLRRLIFSGEGIERTPLQKPLPHWEGQVWLSASVLVRGQGTTDGFHRRLILIPGAMQRRIFAARATGDPLAILSKSAIDDAGKMVRFVLRPAVFVYLAGGPETVQFDRDSAQAWWTRFARTFEALWSEDYFPWLWEVASTIEPDAALQDWVERLRKHALAVLGEAQAALPQRQGRRYRARFRSDRVFWGALYRQFPHLRKEEKDERISGT